MRIISNVMALVLALGCSPAGVVGNEPQGSGAGNGGASSASGSPPALPTAGAGALGTGGDGAGGMPAGAGRDAGQGGNAGSQTVSPTDKPRLFVLTDVSNEPDDEESLVRLLVYSNEFDIQGLVATTSTWLRGSPREDLIRHQLDVYEQVRPNLLKHSADFPEVSVLREATKTGQPGYGMALVGPGQSSAGSQHLIQVADAADNRPLWVSVWGGANTLAQALQDARAERTPEQLDELVAKLRVYSISDQDDAGAWLRTEFPDLFYVVSPSDQSSGDYLRATWTGISGDRYYDNGPGYKFDLVDTPWLTANVIQNHGPLGALYPAPAFIMEGDTPAFLGLIERGLGWSVSPGYGGWGGRYAFLKLADEPRATWTNDNLVTRDSVIVAPGETVASDQATIWRWRDHYQQDFAARMDWCVADEFSKANHNPIPALNGDTSNGLLTLPAKAGSTVTLSAAGTSDPDNHAVKLTWWIYPEAGTLSETATLGAQDGMATDVHLPLAQSPGTLHVILQAEDAGTPPLFAYRRIVLEVTP